MNYFDKCKNVRSILKYGDEQIHRKLSIVIPTYNNPHSLKRAVECSINQIEPSTDYNVVIVENYQGDISDTITLLSKISNPHHIPVSYYQNEENIGMHENWNRCFELADADYVLMVHTDDYLLPRAVLHAKTAIDLGYKAIYSDRFSSRENDHVTRKKIEDEIELQKKEWSVGLTNYRKVNVYDLLFGSCPLAPTGFMVERALFLTTGGFNTKAHSWPSDYEMAFELERRGSLYVCNKKTVVKCEGNGNDGSNLKVTVPLTIADKEVLVNGLKGKFIPFKSTLINMRIASISRSFRIDYDTYLKGLFPKRYLNRYYYFGWKYINRIRKAFIK